MEEYIRKTSKWSLLISILLLIPALFMMVKPLDTVGILFLAFGIILIVSGLIHFVSYFSIEDEYRFFSYELAQSILYIIAGFVIVNNVHAVTQTLAIIVGIWILIESIIKIQIAFNIRDVRNAHWVIMLFISFVSTILGAVLILKPFESAEILIQFTGAILMFTQLIEIYDDFYILNKVGDLDKKRPKKSHIKVVEKSK